VAQKWNTRQKIGAVVLVATLAAAGPAWSFFFPRAGEGKLSMKENTAYLSLTVSDEETGKSKPVELIFMSGSGSSSVTKEDIAGVTTKTGFTYLIPYDAVLSVGRYSVHEPVYPANDDLDNKPVHVIGVVGTDILKPTLRHPASYITFDKSRQKWQLGAAPYRPGSDVTVLPLHKVVDSPEHMGYGVDIAVSGKTTTCIFDTCVSDFLMAPQNAPLSDVTITIGKKTVTGRQTSNKNLEGLGYPEYPHIGFGALPFSKITLDLSQNKLFLEND